jgi:hypothetical protein
VDEVRRIADAVLYEGYVLWPYRRSALKNRQRFTFGGLHPQGWPEDRSEMVAECLLEADGEPSVDVHVRFLHLVRRGLRDAAGRDVDELWAGGERHLAWEEATERELGPGPFAIPAGCEEELLEGGRLIVRSWEALRGEVEVSATMLRPGLHRIRVRVVNRARWHGEPREAVLARTLCSTHAVLHVPDGAFVSLADPPAELRAEAEACRNEGVWPVLAGEPGEHHTMLASPIVLEDHPRVAPESPGDLFDGAEIDQLLTLSILSLTDEEKAEVRATDPRVREILERAERMGASELMRLHGTIRDLHRLGDGP